MKKLVEIVDSEGLEALLGEQVLLLCANYFYTGKLVSVNANYVQLEDASVVYETGAWSEKSYSDVQKLYTKLWYVQTSMIESYGLSK